MDHVIRGLTFLSALLVVAIQGMAADSDLLLRWPAHEGTGAKVADVSGNGLDGKSAAGWMAEGSLKALAFDGEKDGGVRAVVPNDKAIGTGGWTFLAWIRPDVLGYPGQQDQRRIFSYGKYPDASINVDVTGAGRLNWYVEYNPTDGKTVATGGNSSPRIRAKSWIHVAVLMDRKKGRMTVYLNGREAGESALPQDWAGDFSVNNEVAVGATGQKYQGAMADVAIWRRALNDQEIKAEFAGQCETYGVQEGDGMTLIEKLGDIADAGNAAMAQRKTGEARTAFARIVATPDVPAGWAAWAELRAAQAYRLDGDDARAREFYRRIQANANYLPHHRQEAAEILSEMDRAANGLPARDVTASRTKLPEVKAFAADIWVAPDGSDRNPGTADKPVATLARAQELVRAQKARAASPIAVILKNGTYLASQPLALTAEDSGKDGAPVVWKAAEPGKVVIYGGFHLTGFTPVRDPSVLARIAPEAREKVQVCDLKKLGLTDYGTLAVRGFGQPPSPPTVEVYADGEPQTLARWPNKGFVMAGKLVEPGSKPKGIPSVFEYLDDRPARWTKAQDVWLSGYFKYLWADATIKVGSIDPATKRITTDQPYAYGKGDGMDAKEGIKYYAFNLLEELDQPGEWYLDRSTGQLYLWPTGDVAKQTIEIGVLAQPFVTMTDVTNVRMEGLTWDLGRADGIRINGGSDVQLVGCVVRRTAGTGVAIDGGVRHIVLGCDIHHTGRAAIVLRGGDRSTLTRADFVVENCHLHHFGRIDRTYTPAIDARGIGMRFAHNLMHDCPSSAMRVDANEVIVEYNQTHNVVLESDDQGAMENNGNPTFRGMVFRYNRFEDIGNGSTMTAGQAAIRFDDVISGMLVYSNVFIRSASGHFGALQINGGRDNVFDNNLLVDCKAGISGGWRPNHDLWKKIADRSRADFIQNDLYLERYPDMKRMLDKNGQNFCWRMALVDCGTPISQKAGFDVLALGTWNLNDAGIAAAARERWNLSPDCDLVLRLGIRPIPVDEIGLYEDKTRASWPVISTPVAVPEWRKAKQ